ncbi:MAG: hypothetical protein JNM71_14695 [Flavobacterium lindanitolerans]|uniref:hypothetical protein n=1 Tax=Flavobacterium lindanitolerans TaxID=428988 RepID=UPI001A3816E9|nr:hypothetical protein [Flavobacterium lindanitolerans]MBL7869262.1 hypothetical protein [Flavobacterium lindanitolerans]
MKTLEEKIQHILKIIERENDGTTLDFVVPGYVAKPAVAYQSMREDLILCRNAILESLNPAYNEVVKISLFHSVVVIYGKCFTDSTHSKSPKLEISDLGGDKDLLKSHKEIMDMRHNLVAHRGSIEHDLGFTYLSLDAKTLARQVRVKQIRKKGFKIEDYKRYLILIDYLIDVVEKKFAKAAAKIWTHLLENFKPEQLALLKIAGPTNEEK